MIIQAKETDIPKILPLVERLHDKTMHSDIPFCELSAIKSLLFGIKHAGATVLIDDEYKGILGLNIVGHPCNEKYLIAKEVVFCGERLGVGHELAEAGAKWAKSMGCKELLICLEPHICGKTGFRLYKRWGFTPSIAGFVRRL